MKKEFKSLPLESPKAILSSVYKGEKSNIKELESVLSESFNARQYLDKFKEQDALTRMLYERDDDRVILPTKDDVKLNKEDLVKTELGKQENIYHKENIPENISSTIFNLLEKPVAGESRHELGIMGLLSQEGKKYTAISKDGRVGFDEHEKLSAYIAARRYKDMGIGKDKAEPFVVAIYHQNIRQDQWDINIRTRQQILPFRREKEKTYEKTFVERYGERARDLTKALSDANIGHSTEKERTMNQKKFRAGREIINTNLVEYIDRKGLAPEVKDKVGQLSQEKTQKRTEENINQNNKEIQRQTDERLRLERERIERERERQAWIEYEKEQAKFDKALMAGVGALVTATVAGPAIRETRDLLHRENKIGENYLEKLIDNKSETRMKGKEEKLRQNTEINKEKEIEARVKKPRVKEGPVLER